MLCQKPALHAHPNHVGVHRRAGGLEPVAGRPAFIDDLIPKSRLRVLIFFVSRGELLHDPDKRVSLWTVLWQNLQQLDQSHSEPANCAAPMISRLVRRGIGPGLRAALIVCMPEQAGRGIVQVLVINQHLFGRFIVGVYLVVTTPFPTLTECLP